MIWHRAIIVHVEWHGIAYGFPTVSVRFAPQPGDSIVDGGETGTMRRCPLCGSGLLHVPDQRRPGPTPRDHP